MAFNYPLNEISQGLKDLIPTLTLKPSETVIFKRADITALDYYEGKEDINHVVKDGEVVGSTQIHKPSYIITDPFWVNKETKEIEPRQVQIGWKKGVGTSEQEPFTFERPEFLKSTGGTISVTTRTRNYQDLLLYLYLSPNNIQNPLIKLGLIEAPTKNDLPFVVLSFEDINKKIIESKKADTEISDIVLNATDEEITAFVSSMPNEFKPYTADTNVDKLRLVIMAKSNGNQEWFKQNWGNENNGLVQFIEKCKEQRILEFKDGVWNFVKNSTLTPIDKAKFDEKLDFNETFTLLRFFETKDGKKFKTVLSNTLKK
jgi:hypothetical protein